MNRADWDFSISLTSLPPLYLDTNLCSHAQLLDPP